MTQPKPAAVPLPTKEIDLSQTGECFFDTEPAAAEPIQHLAGCCYLGMCGPERRAAAHAAEKKGGA